MSVLILGGTGFIGREAVKMLLAQEETVIVFSRNHKKAKNILSSKIRLISSLNELTSDEHITRILNLAGESLADGRWTEQRKKILISSRIDVTAALIELIRRLDTKPECLINASAVGYFGDSGENLLTEFSDPCEDFGSRLCASWETQALRAKAYGVRVCIVRIGLVIGRDGGFVKKMLPSFKFGLGAQLGNGKQWMSWVHLFDLINIISLLFNDKQMQGIYNAGAPNPTTNAIFTKTLASVLKRPAFLKLPPAFLNLIFGEMAALLLTGQRVIPDRLIKAGFDFKYPHLRLALEEAIK